MILAIVFRRSVPARSPPNSPVGSRLQMPARWASVMATAGQNSGANNAVFPLGLVFPGDKGVPRGLTTTYYKSFAPRIGIAWSPGATEGWLAKLTGGPGKLSVRAGWGIFYNPIEQLVLEQFSAEPPFGGSTFLSNTLFNTPLHFAGPEAMHLTPSLVSLTRPRKHRAVWQRPRRVPTDASIGLPSVRSYCSVNSSPI